MRRQMVAGNWKMHGSRAANQALLAELEMSLKPEWPIDIVVCPPYVYLSDAVRALEDGRIAVGAQDVCGVRRCVHRPGVRSHAQGRRLQLRHRRAFRAAPVVSRG